MVTDDQVEQQINSWFQRQYQSRTGWVDWDGLLALIRNFEDQTRRQAWKNALLNRGPRDKVARILRVEAHQRGVYAQNTDGYEM